MFKEKRIIFYEIQKQNIENNSESLAKDYKKAIERFNKVTKQGITASEKTKKLTVREGKNPTKELAESYNYMEKIAQKALSSFDDNNFSNSELKELNNAIYNYEEAILETNNWIKDMQSKEAAMEDLKEIPKFQEEERNKQKQAEKKIIKALIESNGEKKGKTKVQDAIYDLSQFIDSDDPRNTIQYWNSQWRENKDQWKKQYN